MLPSQLVRNRRRGGVFQTSDVAAEHALWRMSRIFDRLFAGLEKSLAENLCTSDENLDKNFR